MSDLTSHEVRGEAWPMIAISLILNGYVAKFVKPTPKRNKANEVWSRA